MQLLSTRLLFITEEDERDTDQIKQFSLKIKINQILCVHTATQKGPVSGFVGDIPLPTLDSRI